MSRRTTTNGPKPSMLGVDMMHGRQHDSASIIESQNSNTINSGVKRTINDSAVPSPAPRKRRVIIGVDDGDFGPNESALVNVRMDSPDDLSPMRQIGNQSLSQSGVGRSSMITSGVGKSDVYVFRGLDDLSRERRSPENFHPPRESNRESNNEFNVEVTEAEH